MSIFCKLSGKESIIASAMKGVKPHIVCNVGEGG